MTRNEIDGSTGDAAAALLQALREAVGAAHVLTEPDALAPFLQDWRGRYRGEALAVVLPASTQQVSAVVRACASAGVEVVPQGGNTGLVAGATPLHSPDSDGGMAVVVALGRMNRIREIDAVGNTMVADAGCVLETLQRAADEQGRLYAVAFGAQGSCQIGGSVSTNAGGTGVLKYGGTREQVLGLEVVLPDGRIWDGLRTLRKDNAGYALKHLFIGAEGTLGIVTAVALRLHPKPAVTAAAWLTLDSVDDALHCLAELRSGAGDRIAGYELLNRAQLRAVLQQFPQVRLPVDPAAPYAVLLELNDTDARADLNGLLEQLLPRLSASGHLRDAAIAASEAQRASFWHIRHAIAEANRKFGMGLTADVAVPVKSLPAFIANASRTVQARYPQVQIVLVAHMGDGNVHFVSSFSFEDWNGFADQPRVAAEVRALVHDEAVALGGTFSAEHGIGHVLAGELERLRSPIELELMRTIRAAIDPQQRMNRGKVLSER